MTREQAVAVTKALNDIEDFELFIEQIEIAYDNSDGNLSEFFQGVLMPVLEKELNRRKEILTTM